MNIFLNKFFLTLLTGVVFGAVDILPMLKMKLDKHAIISAFVFYLIVPFIVYNTDLFGMAWWLKGGVITLLLSLPVVIIVAKDGMESAAPIIVMSIVLGTLIGVVGNFLINV
jgi:hypothetical protein